MEKEKNFVEDVKDVYEYEIEISENENWENTLKFLDNLSVLFLEDLSEISSLIDIDITARSIIESLLDKLDNYENNIELISINLFKMDLVSIFKALSEFFEKEESDKYIDSLIERFEQNELTRMAVELITFRKNTKEEKIEEVKNFMIKKNIEINDEKDYNEFIKILYEEFSNPIFDIFNIDTIKKFVINGLISPKSIISLAENNRIKLGDFINELFESPFFKNDKEIEKFTKMLFNQDIEILINDYLLNNDNEVSNKIKLIKLKEKLNQL